MISRITGIPLLVRVGSNNEAIYTATGLPMMPRLLRFRAIERIVERLVLSNAAMVIAANQNNMEFAISSGASLERISVIRYGNLIHPCHLVDPQLRSTTLDNFPARYFTFRAFILYIGRLEPVKQVDQVVRLLARVRETGLDTKLVICGDGSLREELQALAMNLEIAHSVYFAGNRNQEWLAKIIPQAALVVSPHTGRALCEVAYGAAPVVAYDVDWQGELIEDRITGLLVPFMDLDGLFHACLELLTDRSLAQSLGGNLRKRALEIFDRETINCLEKSCYLRAIKQVLR
jgi:glycosyltransferase involved in cell wall biosynthesis